MAEVEVKPKKAGPIQCSICSQRRAALKRPKTLEQVLFRPSQFHFNFLFGSKEKEGKSEVNTWNLWFLLTHVSSFER